MSESEEKRDPYDCTHCNQMAEAPGGDETICSTCWYNIEPGGRFVNGCGCGMCMRARLRAAVISDDEYGAYLRGREQCMRERGRGSARSDAVNEEQEVKRPGRIEGATGDEALKWYGAHAHFTTDAWRAQFRSRDALVDALVMCPPDERISIGWTNAEVLRVIQEVQK